MKRIILFTFCVYFSLLHKGIAQTVTIPDANFVTYLHSIVPTAMNGNQMDTSSLAVKRYKDIYVDSLNISNLTGVQYFDSVTTLYCYQNSLTCLPALPKMLQTLWCYNNQLTSLPTLPNSLTTLLCGSNSLTSLPALPNSLKTLWCDINQLTSLPALPNSLQQLYCGYNKLTSLPVLPDSLIALECVYNQISCFPVLPNTITSLIIYDNPFTCLPNYLKCMNKKQNAIGSPLNTFPLCNIDNSSGCPASTDAPTAIIIPNIFTPNGDSINDTFFVKGANLINFSCKIYDRWGMLLYQWTDINTGWNGKDKNGATSADGTYYYIITYTDNTGKTNTKNGFFQLLR